MLSRRPPAGPSVRRPAPAARSPGRCRRRRAGSAVPGRSRPGRPAADGVRAARRRRGVAGPTSARPPVPLRPGAAASSRDRGGPRRFRRDGRDRGVQFPLHAANNAAARSPLRDGHRVGFDEPPDPEPSLAELARCDSAARVRRLRSHGADGSEGVLVDDVRLRGEQRPADRRGRGRDDRRLGCPAVPRAAGRAVTTTRITRIPTRFASTSRKLSVPASATHVAAAHRLPRRSAVVSVASATSTGPRGGERRPHGRHVYGASGRTSSRTSGDHRNPAGGAPRSARTASISRPSSGPSVSPGGSGTHRPWTQTCPPTAPPAPNGVPDPIVESAAAPPAPPQLPPPPASPVGASDDPSPPRPAPSLFPELPPSVPVPATPLPSNVPPRGVV